MKQERENLYDKESLYVRLAAAATQRRFPPSWPTGLSDRHQRYFFNASGAEISSSSIAGAVSKSIIAVRP